MYKTLCASAAGAYRRYRPHKRWEVIDELASLEPSIAFSLPVCVDFDFVLSNLKCHEAPRVGDCLIETRTSISSLH